MSATRNPRDLHTAFGGIALGVDSQPTCHLTKSETDLRRSLASVAYAYGWGVQEEVVIPGWGRIDILLSAAQQTFLVELKIDLTKPASIRRAFQQADGYGRWWTNNKGTPADVFLCAAEMDDAAIASVAAAYPMVGPKSVGNLLGFLEYGGTRSGRSARAIRAKVRAARAALVSEFHAAAAARLRSQVLDSAEVSDAS